MKQSVIFDIGGVLAHDVWEHLLCDVPDGVASRYNLDAKFVRKTGELLWEQFAYTPQTADADWKTLEKNYWQTFIAMIWGNNQPLDVTIQTFIDESSKYIKPVDGMAPILERLTQNGIPRAICSNNTEFWLHYQMEFLDLQRFFDPQKVIVSSKVGFSKKSPGFEMFHAVTQALQCPADRCVFIDDREENIDHAKRYGMNSILFKDAVQLNKVLLGIYKI